MTRVTYNPGPGGPKETTWGKQTFEAGKAVDIEDERMIEKARNNRYFSVSGDKKQKDDGTDDAGMATPVSAAHPPMFPDAHVKAEVTPGGTVTDTEPEPEAEAPRRGRPKSSG